MVALLLCGAAADVFAQGVQTGTLRGLITDPSDLPVVGATVTITSTALQGQRTTSSDGAGNYVFLALPPGDYQIKSASSSFAEAQRTATVPLGATVEQNISLTLAPIAENVNVTGSIPPPLVTAPVGINIKHDEVGSLATSRTLQGIATLSPGLNELTPNPGQVAINGAFAFDNVFMINGVDVNDNLLGSPQDLFIEDAIDETQVLTSGISAEYGRFSGGVINAITKNGGNRFSGSYRLYLSNPSWVNETPFEVANGTTHQDVLNKTHEATLGGPIVRDRLWFFTSGRLARQSIAQTLRETGIGITQVDDNKRGEVKVTGTPSSLHTIQGGYLNNASSTTNTSGLFSLAADPNTLVTRTKPNWYAFANYRGVLHQTYLVEAQYSERRFAFQGAGTSTAIIDSPYYSPSADVIFNAPYFDASDQDHRNNRQLTGNVLSFFDARGRHETKIGYEFYRSQRTGGGSQSATDYVIDADYVTNASGAPVLDSTQRPIPIFVPDETVIEHYIAIRGAELNIDNSSVYARDHWTVNRHMSADVGIRLEHVASAATGGIQGVDATVLVPRLAIAYDVNGDGRWLLHSTYGHYAGRYNEAQIGGNTNVGNADYTYGTYEGPAGQGRNFAPGLNPANYVTDFGSFPTANVSFAGGLSSPITKEFTAAAGRSLARGYGEASYIWRSTSNVIEDFTTLKNGTTHVVRSGFDAGTFTNKVFDNSNIGERHYQAAVLQGHVDLRRDLLLNGSWTIQLKNEGNYEGEATNQPGQTSLIGDYAEAFNAARNFPYGRLNSFQRHKVRIWSVYNDSFGRWGALTISGLLRVDSGQAYSLRASSQSLTTTQKALLAAYPDRPANQPVYFGGRGTELFKGYGVVDASIGYDIPVAREMRPYLRFDVFNLLNNDKLIAWNTTVRQDANSPKDALGLATGYTKGSSFGLGTSNIDYPQSAVGTGLRGFRIALGVRF
jgi:hypothetical protein